MLNSFLYSSVTLMQLSQLMNLIYLELLTAMRGGCFSAFVLNVLCQFRKQGDNVHSLLVVVAELVPVQHSCMSGGRHWGAVAHSAAPDLANLAFKF